MHYIRFTKRPILSGEDNNMPVLESGAAHNHICIFFLSPLEPSLAISRDHLCRHITCSNSNIRYSEELPDSRRKTIEVVTNRTDASGRESQDRASPLKLFWRRFRLSLSWQSPAARLSP